uniref:Uncharacterized protein n=1 Tax=Amphimedon queenslandica TaxID=400682 RepID=A0A1X7SFH1_AMPQE
MDYKGNQPLHYAACQGHKEIVSILGKKVSQDGLSKCMESTKQLAGPDIMELLNNHYEDNRSLIDACKSGNVDIVRHLVIDKHCDVNAKGTNGYTPLHYACEKDHFEIVEILTNHLQYNSIEAETDYNERPLHKACESGNVDIVRHLVIDKHCDVNAKGRNGYTPLHYACDNGHFEIVKFLTNQPQCNIEAKASFIKIRPLHLACKSGNVDIVRHLVIDKHCNVNAKGRNGYTPLHYACDNGHFEIVKFLTNQPQCNIEAKASFIKIRPLHLACKSGNVDIVRHLVIDKHCNVNTKDRNGYTPLHKACVK